MKSDTSCSRISEKSYIMWYKLVDNNLQNVYTYAMNTQGGVWDEMSVLQQRKYKSH